MTDASGAAPNVANLLAAERTALAFERNALASDRTLMATVRTSLSLIGFGFTIYSFFTAISGTYMLDGRIPPRTPVVFGMALILLGIILLSAAIRADVKFRRSTNKRREELSAQKLLPPVDALPPSLAVLAAVLLLLIGLSAILAIVLRL